MVTLRDGTVIDESHDAVHFFTPVECRKFYGLDRVVEYITIHHWGNYGQDFNTVRNFLCSRRDNNPTSAHAVIEAGRAASIISPDCAAFHSGNATGNARSIGLELRPEATEGDYITAAAYIFYLRGIYGDVPLRKHSDWFATACPGKWDLAKLDRMARAVETTPIEVVPQSNPVPAPIANTGNNGHNPETEIHWVVEAGDSLSKVANYYYGADGPANVSKLAAYNGISNPNSIAVGQLVFIPGPVAWTVEAPDELVTIAAYYGMDADVLAQNNGLPNGQAEIFVGQVLRII
jgi:N-acetylmuramoyl-L-alanine amidase